jgi:hypothetical protein
MVTITIVPHKSGVFRVHENMTAPVEQGAPTPPEAKKFSTHQEARANAEQLQAKHGGPNKAVIIDLTHPTKRHTAA